MRVQKSTKEARTVSAVLWAFIVLSGACANEDPRQRDGVDGKGEGSILTPAQMQGQAAQSQNNSPETSQRRLTDPQDSSEQRSRSQEETTDPIGNGESLESARACGAQRKLASAALVTADSGVNVRENPSSESERMDGFRSGATVKVWQSLPGENVEWRCVTGIGMSESEVTGWVTSSWIELTPET